MADLTLIGTQVDTLKNFLKEQNHPYRLSSPSYNIGGKDFEIKQKISIPFMGKEKEIKSILGSNLSFNYYDTKLKGSFNVRSYFNFGSFGYESLTSDSREIELPNFYIEFPNDENLDTSNLKALNTRYIDKSFFEDISVKQSSLNVRALEDLERMNNVMFGTSYNNQRSKMSLEDFPYYNTITLGMEKAKYCLKFLEKINFKENFFSSVLEENKFSNFSFTKLESDENISLQMVDLLDVSIENQFLVNNRNKIILGKQKPSDSPFVIPFKKMLLNGFINSQNKTFVKNYKNILENEICENEIIVYKVEKYLNQVAGDPIQSFWFYSDKELYEYYDIQIRKDQTYIYNLKSYVILYGTSYTLTEISSDSEKIEALITLTPSFKITQISTDSVKVNVSPKPQLEPAVRFFNESDSENKIKIYLDLQYGYKSSNYVPLNNEDEWRIAKQKTNLEGKYDFQYSKEDGKFEVYRVKSKPSSYRDFETAKILDVRGSRSSTSVIFYDIVASNTKYYYIFRALNSVNMPSNPTSVYEVELVKDSDDSKVEVRTVNLQEETIYHDKNFKNLFQIKPAFEQRVYEDDTTLTSYKGKINDVTLGTAEDKVWGKRFKIRMKSKDTGKIVDFNIKFNLNKNKSKEDL